MRTLLILACVGASATAAAQPPVFVTAEPLPFVKVSYADLDLGQPSDIGRLQSRVRRAAHGLCFDATRDPIDLSVLERGCFKTSLASADAQISRAAAARLDGSIAAAAQVIVIQAK